MTKSLLFLTIKMGLELYVLTKNFDKSGYKGKTSDDFYNDYLNKKFPEKFYKDFNTFVKKYKFWGEWEFDIKNPRFNDNPKSIINQIYSSLIITDINRNPKKDFDETSAKRPQVFQKLLKIAKEKGFGSEFEDAYNLMIKYFHYRESPRYFVVFSISQIRRVIMKRAQVLLEKK